MSVQEDKAAVISQTYGISGVTPSGTVESRQAVAEVIARRLPADLKSFFTRYHPNAADISLPTWPASSLWVTAEGVDQQPGQEEVGVSGSRR